MKTFETSELLKAIKGSAGIMSTIAKKLNCDWHTAKKRIDENDDALKAYNNENENVLDLAESKLIENINDNDNTAIIFYLKTKGRNRGYVERQEIAHSGEIKTENIIHGVLFEVINPQDEQAKS